MAIDISGLNEKELKKLSDDVAKALEKLKKNKAQAALKAAEAAAKKHGFELSELVETPKKRVAKKTKSAAKYRNPKDASQTWTGRGRQPGWIKDAISAGKDLSAYEI
ncbi:MAG: H-NS histone family protein [Rhodobacteraceae bacterium]|nr:H-NS histone family protein [Alphaproteobacteria bacterium]NNF71028.1 H-NS histone family protein [Paracoccaceae bacterium]NNK67077.1 H-NS histone family protein [Paracoccaceae bacterium]